jgi:hypothetical protein
MLESGGVKDNLRFEMTENGFNEIGIADASRNRSDAGGGPARANGRAEPEKVVFTGIKKNYVANPRTRKNSREGRSNIAPCAGNEQGVIRHFRLALKR